MQPFAHGELSALRMQGTPANPLGFMQVPYTNMPPASASNQWNLLNYGTGHVRAAHTCVMTCNMRTPAAFPCSPLPSPFSRRGSKPHPSALAREM